MDETIDLKRYWKILKEKRRVLLSIIGGVTFATVLFALVLTKTYLASATLMPIGGESGSSLGAIAAQMGLGGFVGSLGGGGGSLGSATRIIVILQSRTLAEQMIQELDLKKKLFAGQWDATNQSWRNNKEPSMEQAAAALKGRMTFQHDRVNQLVLISGEFEDASEAAQMVNRYVEQLTSYLDQNAVTEAKRNRIFIEAQLDEVRIELLESGKELATFYATKNISNVDATVDVSVRSPLREESESDVLPGRFALLADASTTSPGDTAFFQQKSVLEEQVGELQEKIQRAKKVQDVPQQVYLQYLTQHRQLVGQLNTMLSQQYQWAKIEEARKDLKFQVIDWARPPENKYRPKRRQIVMIGFVVSVLIAFGYLFAQEYLQRNKLLQ